MLKNIESDEGFFKKFYSKFVHKFSDDQLKTFSKFTTDTERFSFLYKLSEFQELKVNPSLTNKRKDVAVSLKEEGNKHFGKANYQDALHLYTKSILNTPWSQGNTRDLSIALANRSAALYHLNEHNLALHDLNWISSLDYPKELQYKTKERKARSFLATKQLQSALQAFKEALSALTDAKLPLEKKQKLQCDFQIMISLLSKQKELKDEMQREDISPQKLTGGANAQYEAASKSVIIKYSEDMGRFAEAAKKINTGETILLEDAHCAVLLSEKCRSNCFQCFKRFRAPFPCSQCNVVAFCSRKCQEVALKTHHKIECPVLQTLWDSGSSITCLMALRILSQRGLKYFLNLRSKLEEGLCNEKYHTSNYVTVYNLVSHADRRTPEDLLHRASMAVFLLFCLKATSFFSDESTYTNNEKTEVEEFIGGLILRHLQVLQFNAHEIFEFQYQKDNSVFIGGGLYPTLALFNHSCNPAVARYFNGTSVIVRTVRPVTLGEMIAENYGPIFTQTPKEERQVTLLNQYWFNCSCTPCVENWPTFMKMDPNILRFKCDGSKNGCKNTILVPLNSHEILVQCSVCQVQTNIFKGLKALADTDDMFKSARRLVAAHNIHEALAKFIKILDLLSETLVPPFRDYHLCQQEIRKCMLNLGNIDSVQINNR